MSHSLKSEFLLNPDVIFLNHGSFGACPRTVLETYQRWQRELEYQPVEFLIRRLPGWLAEARAKLAAYLGVAANEVMYFPNATTAMNVVARSLPLRPGDEILTTDHEYPAMDNLWDFICQRTGARCVRQSIPLPLTTADDFVETFWAGVTERTKVVFISHITCSTALIFPVQEICRRARAAGLLSLVDGAHAPGQIPLDLTAIGADIYVGNCHKWLCAPKGSAFLYARPEVQDWLEPLVISIGWGKEYPDSASRFIRYHEWQGTRDPSAFLSVPAAIEFQAQHDWDVQRRRCHELASSTRRRINALTGLAPLCPDSPEWFSQMVSIRLPHAMADALSRLYDDYRIEVPVITWKDQLFIRVSFQAYNDQKDADALVEALSELLRASTPNERKPSCTI